MALDMLGKVIAASIPAIPATTNVSSRVKPLWHFRIARPHLRRIFYCTRRKSRSHATQAVAYCRVDLGLDVIWQPNHGTDLNAFRTPARRGRESSNRGRFTTILARSATSLHGWRRD